MGPGNFRLYVAGRLRGVTRQRLAALAEAAGGRLVRQPGLRADLVCLAHGTAAEHLSDVPALRLPDGVPADAAVLSEMALRRRLGLDPPRTLENRMLSAADVAGRSRLSLGVIRCLALYDVLEPEGEAYGYRDLLAAREVRRLLDAALPLSAIVQAAVALRDAGRSLSDTRLREAPWGEMLQEVAGRLGRLDGQFTLPLAESFESVDALFGRAEALEQEGELAGAERLYRIAAGIDRADPVLPFNLGNVLDALGKTAEAALAYRQAIARDPAFAEAWLNLGLLREAAGDPAGAAGCYGQALAVRPDYSDALFNLALLRTRQGDPAVALPLWERFLALKPDGTEARQARRLAMLCRMNLRGEAPDTASRQAAVT
jgi:tetratricopeptide (TPR) repeat protein